MTIDDAYQLLKTRANDKGVINNIDPIKFNIIWPKAELRFFNNAYRVYAETQVISDSISKWMSDPLYLLPSIIGRFNFFEGMRLLHVDSMNGYLLSISTTGSVGSLNTLVGGSGYTNGTYDNITLTGGTGSGIKANITVLGGAIVAVNYLNDFGTGYTVNDVLTGAIPAGSGWSIRVGSIVDSTPYDITRSEKNKIAAHLSSTYDAPDREFSIYTQYSSWFQFYPTNIIAQLVYLKNPIPSYWGYQLVGGVATLTGLTGGTAYTNGIYTNVPLTGGTGSTVLATITIIGGAVTAVVVTKAGKGYHNGDVLSANSANIGGTGTGFLITISSIVNPRPVYDPNTSIQPLWNDNDISLIVDYALVDVAVNSRDNELSNFAAVQTQSKVLQ